MNAWNKFCEIPFVPGGRSNSGCDCWGLVRLVYRQDLGIELPSFEGQYSDTVSSQTFKLVSLGIESSDWHNTHIPRPYDVVLLEIMGRPLHVGIFTKPGHMLSTGRDMTASAVCKFRSLLWCGRVHGFYRHIASDVR